MIPADWSSKRPLAKTLIFIVNIESQSDTIAVFGGTVQVVENWGYWMSTNSKHAIIEDEREVNRIPACTATFSWQ